MKMKIIEAQNKLNKCSQEILSSIKFGWLPYHSQLTVLVSPIDITVAIDIREIENKSDKQIKIFIVERIYDTILNKLEELHCCEKCGRYLEENEKCYCWNDG